jgi:hypothetical protein
VRAPRRTDAEINATLQSFLDKRAREAVTLRDLWVRLGVAEREEQPITISPEELALLNFHGFDEFLDDLTVLYDVPPPLDLDGDCHVYFIQSGCHGPIKIGRGADPEKRLKELQTGSPQPLFLLGSIVGAPHNEGRLHHHFRGSQMRGEWFRPTRGLLEFIAEYAS